MRANKNFLSKPLEVLFLACLFGCYVNDVCLSCLLNTIVSQHNACALVIMLLFMLLVIFPKPLSWQTLLCIQIILFIQIGAKIYFFRQSFYQKLSIYKIIWTYKVEWSHYFTNFYFVASYKRISNTFEKTLQRRCLCLHLFLNLPTKALLLYLELFST
jgi:hypothetical protein